VGSGGDVNLAGQTGSAGRTITSLAILSGVGGM